MMEARTEYCTAGGNCHPSAADWNNDNQAFAYGAGPNLGISVPSSERQNGVYQLLSGHTANINAVKFLYVSSFIWIVTGSADGQIGFWRPTSILDSLPSFELVEHIKAHEGSIDCIEAIKGFRDYFLSGSADGSIKFWNLRIQHAKCDCVLLQTITNKRTIPLSISLHSIIDDGVICAVSGTQNTIDIYTLENGNVFVRQKPLSGHNSWIRALDFIQHPKGRTQLTGSTLLASASQDKLIRIWKIAPEIPIGSKLQIHDSVDKSSEENFYLSSSPNKFSLLGKPYQITFEALLAGHEDWIYSIKWNESEGPLQLLSASADNTIAIWELNHSDDTWAVTNRIGDLSAQKGATSATGSMGGFWNCLWSPNGEQFVGLTKTGSWRRWQLLESGLCREELGLSGHVKPVTDLDWAQNGSYLLSTSLDQTTRLHSEWVRESHRTWHEISRPQIHGYEVKCIGTLGETSFVSGSDEKPLRVFDIPDEIAEVLARLNSFGPPLRRQIHAADVPILGLSNKSDKSITENVNSLIQFEQAASAGIHPEGDREKHCLPLEDQLSKRTLWPEKEKLYGHGLEVCALAVSSDGLYVASSCKASSLEHAVIRIFSTIDWQQIIPPLKAHTLTVTSLQFSRNDKMLLSAGRDRQIAVWRRLDEDDDRGFVLHAMHARAHSRIIYSTAWLQSDVASGTFVTSSRDKFIRIWNVSSNGTITLYKEMATTAAVTAMHSVESALSESFLAAGMETGELHIYHLAARSFEVLDVLDIRQSILSSFAINRVVWRPSQAHALLEQDESLVGQLAVAGEDHSIRLLSIHF